MFPGLPVIFLTAKTDTSHVVEGFESGGTDYIKKPFSIEELIVRIENQINLRKGRIRTGNVTENLNIGKYVLETSRYELRSPKASNKIIKPGYAAS